MRPAYPIFRETEDTPSPREGIAIARPLEWRDSSVWLHGRLTLAKLDAEAAKGRRGRAWSRALYVTAITELDGVPQIASLGGDRAVFAPPRWQPTHIEGLVSLPFCVDLSVAFRYPLARERAWVHVSAREHCSEIVPLDPEDRGPLRREERAIDSLLVAYGHARAGALVEAAEAFGRAFADDDLRREVDGGHLYDSACCLAHGSDTRWRQLALDLLREDLERRVTAHSRAVAGWLRGAESEREELAERREELDRALREHVDWLRRDPDLDPIRDVLDVDEMLAEIT